MKNPDLIRVLLLSVIPFTWADTSKIKKALVSFCLIIWKHTTKPHIYNFASIVKKHKKTNKPLNNMTRVKKTLYSSSSVSERFISSIICNSHLTNHTEFMDSIVISLHKSHWLVDTMTNECVLMTWWWCSLFCSIFMIMAFRVTVKIFAFFSSLSHRICG